MLDAGGAGCSAVVLPTLPPESQTFHIPAKMSPEEQARLIVELGKISTEIAKLETRAEERGKAESQRFRAIDARLAKLEDGAETTGQHDVETLRRALERRESEFSKWRFWALSIFAVLFCSAVSGLVVHWISTR